MIFFARFRALLYVMIVLRLECHIYGVFLIKAEISVREKALKALLP